MFNVNIFQYHNDLIWYHHLWSLRVFLICVSLNFNSETKKEKKRKKTTAVAIACGYIESLTYGTAGINNMLLVWGLVSSAGIMNLDL